MAKYLLKYEKKFWDKIADGSKKFEVRKPNKDYIKSGDIIVGSDLCSKVVYGEAKVTHATLENRRELIKSNVLDKETLDFVIHRYVGIKKVIVLRVEHIKDGK